MKRTPKRSRAQSGQMSVELAVVLPVLLVAMVIVLDCLAYLGECAQFDHLAAQAVLAQGTSPAKGAYSENSCCSAVKKDLETYFKGKEVKVSVTAKESGMLPIWRTRTYTCTMKMAPWPFRQGGLSVFGLHVPTTLDHSYALTVDTYVPGKLL